MITNYALEKVVKHALAGRFSDEDAVTAYINKRNPDLTDDDRNDIIRMIKIALMRRMSKTCVIRLQDPITNKIKKVPCNMAGVEIMLVPFTDIRKAYNNLDFYVGHETNFPKAAIKDSDVEHYRKMYEDEHIGVVMPDPSTVLIPEINLGAHVWVALEAYEIHAAPEWQKHVQDVMSNSEFVYMLAHADVIIDDK